MDENSNIFPESTSGETFVLEVKEELSEIDSAELTEHAARFEALHGKLTQALNSIDGL